MKPRGGYRRALLKLSGAAFAPAEGKGFDEGQVSYIARELAAGYQVCHELALVIGGGNILRGARLRPEGANRLLADYAGMIATVLNALVLQDGLRELGVPCRLYSALPVPPVAVAVDAERCRGDLSEGRVVILAGGTGNPLFTTDTAAALRGVELEVEIVLKATRVDGVYSADPEKHPDARLFSRLTYCDVLNRALGAMDLCAVSLCMEHRLPVRVFNYRVEGNMRRALAGEPVGTLIGE